MGCPGDEISKPSGSLLASDEMKSSMQSWSGKYTDVQAECCEHGVSQTGTTKEMVKRLREHYKMPHVDRTWRAQAQNLSVYFAKPV